MADANQHYEVEIKSLLGHASAAEELRQAMKRLDPRLALQSSYTQLNHYFEGGSPERLADVLTPYLPSAVIEQMHLMAKAPKVSVRTREMNGEAKIVLKATMGNDSSENGVARLELEEVVPKVVLDQLDHLVIEAGYKYQAKWSRTREEYTLRGITICLDKNAGYGYLVELEQVVGSEAELLGARSAIEALMLELGLKELPQERLERMFAYYNEHWPEYYGTEKVFTIE